MDAKPGMVPQGVLRSTWSGGHGLGTLHPYPWISAKSGEHEAVLGRKRRVWTRNREWPVSAPGKAGKAVESNEAGKAMTCYETCCC